MRAGRHIALVLITIFCLSAKSPGVDRETSRVFIPGTAFTFTMYNAKDSVLEIHQFFVDSVLTSENQKKAIIRGVLLAPGKTSGPSVNAEFVCTNESFIADTKYLLLSSASEAKGVKCTFKSSPLHYPFSLKVGDTLANANATMSSRQKMEPLPDIVLSASLKIKDRRCDSVASVTTPAGSWECFRIKYTEEVRANPGAGSKAEMNFHVVEWFSHDVGTVRLDYYDNGILHHYAVLTGFNNPK